MEIKKTNFLHRVASLALALVMVLSVIVVAVPTEVSAADKSFKSKGKSSVTITDEECYYSTGQDTWIKYKATANGYLKISASNASTTSSYTAGYWCLYNKTKATAVSPDNVYNTNYTNSYYYTDVYGVKKGVTYYLNVRAYAGTTINASFTKVTDKSGAKKSKALNLKQKKATTGLIRVGDTKVSDWYKFTINSKKKLNVTITPYTNDSISITISGPGVYTKTSTISSSYYGKKCPFTTTGKVKAGTYYIQIKPAKKTTSGFYKISWK